ncbi:hypothetical protein H8S17_09645 [Roseburia sp. BX1005]|uniref:Uncharacterized protein n=1 Tax=Roseburia zhanii TaxID=2763064 RepID=A0A923LP24_9FIRM|nr:hypothetical protein [Roseburia zhanii]MBC5714470.1 hypothetical protein [Roseburia zhanii]
MKEVMQQYGSAAITVVAGLLLFVYIFWQADAGGTHGLMQISQKMAVLEQKDYTDYADAKETAEVIKRANPVITFQNIKVVTGKSYAIQDLFLGEDADGNEAELKILEIKGSRVGEQKVMNGTINFMQQGNYRIWVQATDREGKAARNIFTIPVVCR